MNAFRFLKKCLFDPPAAVRSARLAAREFYGNRFWKQHPSEPLRYELSGGGALLLQPGHSFTQCFWPGVDAYEPEVRHAIPRLLKPGDTFVDCGSNIGYFSVVAGRKVGPTGHVLSIEANPETYKLLKRNLEANGFGKALHCAVAARKGEVELFMPMEGGDVYSSLSAEGLAKSDHMRSFRVPGRTMDDIVASERLKKVDVIKIDVEGGEMDVLASAGETMERFRPVILLEYSTNTWHAFGATAERLIDLAGSRRYSIYSILPDGSFSPAGKDVWSEIYANLALVPGGRSSGAA